jgi:dihydrofolate reductase
VPVWRQIAMSSDGSGGLWAMGDLRWHVTMSLDGFIAGPGDAMDWVFEHGGPDAVADDVIATTGAIVVGRRTYEVEDRERGGFYGGAWSGPFFVVTHEPPAAVPEWMTGTFVTDGVGAAVTRARAAAGAADVVVFGASVARQCIEQGLLDEIVVHLAPVLLGDGVRLFGAPGGARVDLERTALGASGQITDLRFRVQGRR